MTHQYTAYYKSKIGIIEIVGTSSKILSVGFVEEYDDTIGFKKKILARPEGGILVSRTYSTSSRIPTDNAVQNLFLEAYMKYIPKCLKLCFTQLDEYFRGKRKVFSIPFQLHGTAFQKKVWHALLDIPYGLTKSYGDIAGKIGHKNAFRAVGNANNKNRIAIMIPCHRVIGMNGRLTGYAAGIWRKKWLLEHEKSICIRETE